jgi:hypothetical protein
VGSEGGDVSGLIRQGDLREGLRLLPTFVEGEMEPVLQVVVTKIDREEGGVKFKVTSFGKTGVIDSWEFHDFDGAITCVRGEMEDLVAP